MAKPPKIEIEIKIGYLKEFLEALKEKYHQAHRVTDNGIKQRKKIK